GHLRRNSAGISRPGHARAGGLRRSAGPGLAADRAAAHGAVRARADVIPTLHGPFACGAGHLRALAGLSADSDAAIPGTLGGGLGPGRAWRHTVARCAAVAVGGGVALAGLSSAHHAREH